jgi:4-amino-4-deoxy-L-arabinose transferase-like glycosyltransferase
LIDKLVASRGASLLALFCFLVAASAALFTERPGVDESLFADPAAALARDGNFASPHLDASALPGIARHTYWIHPLQPLLLAPVFAAVGTSVFAQRVLSLCFALLLLWSWRRIARELFSGSLVPSLVFALLCGDYLLLAAAGWGRMDMMAASLGWLAPALYLTLRVRHWRAALCASSAAVCLSCLTHPNGLVFAAVLAACVVYFDRHRWRSSDLVPLLAPCFLAAALWGLYIAQDPESFLAQYRANAGDGGRARVFREPWKALYWEISERYVQAFGLGSVGAGRQGLASLKALVWLFYWAAAAASLWRWRRHGEAERWLCLVLLIVFGFLTFLDGQKMFYYLVYLSPVYVCLLACALAPSLVSPGPRKWAAASLLALFCALGWSGMLVRARSLSYWKSYEPAVQYLRDHRRPGELILGNPVFLYGLDFPPGFVGDMGLGYRSGLVPRWIAVDREFDANLSLAQRKNPDLYAHLVNRLAACRLAWPGDSFRIYDCPAARN